MAPNHFVLLDAPAQPTRRIQVARLGEYTDKRYGDFAITGTDFDSWKANLGRLPGGEALIDLEHRSERKPRDSEAAGWITDLQLDGDKVMADVRWTPLGEQKVRDGLYRFLSPSYGAYTDETGQTHENTLVSAALTNKPFLGSMPAVTLASDERVQEAVEEELDRLIELHSEHSDRGVVVRLLDVPVVERRQAAREGHALPDGSYPVRNRQELHSAAVLAASGHGNVPGARKLIRRRAQELGVDLATLPGFGDTDGDVGGPDSQRTMDSDTVIQTLDLDAGADDTAILEALRQLKARADTPVEPVEPAKTLEAQAAEQGLMLLDADRARTLERQAAAGEAASLQLHAQRFEHAFDAALSHTDGPKVTPAERDTLKHFYTLDADATLQMIEDREPVVPARPAGVAALDLSQDTIDPQAAVAAGYYPDSIDLDKRIKLHLHDKGLPMSDYVKVLDQFTRDGVL